LVATAIGRDIGGANGNVALAWLDQHTHCSD
jgi:hypothetical protein